ncbi:hypothetical protein FHQ08_07815 [Lactobacillus sp. CC-MHH1034]|uniref:hypothetical protein n=1 Tax=Agrilactobacillus fermenti TaxID=2586909 RepID=UPI001E42CC82|nr:hypothetical protein [Agrilactobacillus fermenti]MCD2256625.1 hypothetical protein [Agrilactobacillus fermenti]
MASIFLLNFKLPSSSAATISPDDIKWPAYKYQPSEGNVPNPQNGSSIWGFVTPQTEEVVTYKAKGQISITAQLAKGTSTGEWTFVVLNHNPEKGGWVRSIYSKKESASKDVNPMTVTFNMQSNDVGWYYFQVLAISPGRNPDYYYSKMIAAKIEPNGQPATKISVARDVLFNGMPTAISAQLEPKNTNATAINWAGSLLSFANSGIVNTTIATGKLAGTTKERVQGAQMTTLSVEADNSKIGTNNVSTKKNIKVGGLDNLEVNTSSQSPVQWQPYGIDPKYDAPNSTFQWYYYNDLTKDTVAKPLIDKDGIQGSKQKVLTFNTGAAAQRYNQKYFQLVVNYTDPVTKKSTSFFSNKAQLIASDKGTLELVSVPQLFSFEKMDSTGGNPSVQEISTSGAVLEVKIPPNDDDKPTIRVRDTRAVTDPSWELDVSLVPFEYLDSDPDLPKSLGTGDGGQTELDVGFFDTDTRIMDDGVPVLALASNDRGNDIAKKVYWSELHIPQTPNIQTGTYQAVLTWNLVAAPTAQAPTK